MYPYLMEHFNLLRLLCSGRGVHICSPPLQYWVLYAVRRVQADHPSDSSDLGTHIYSSLRTGCTRTGECALTMRYSRLSADLRRLIVLKTCRRVERKSLSLVHFSNTICYADRKELTKMMKGQPRPYVRLYNINTG